MYFVGDIIKLNWKRKDYPMIMDEDGWESYITRQIVFIPSPGKFLVKYLKHDREDMIGIEDISHKIESNNG